MSSESVGWVEYERRFLVTDPTVVQGHEPSIVNQAYLYAQGGWTVRVRRTFRLGTDGLLSEDVSRFGLKGPRLNARRLEVEWDLNTDWAAQLFATATHKVFKRRYHLVTDSGLCDLDEFFFDNEGLMIAEFETTSPQPSLQPPDWCGPEVTNKRRYDNENLAMHPFLDWNQEERSGRDL
jgi:adenylate cyclase